MVQTYQSPVRIYKYPFELVMAAYQMRFPTCPQIPIFVGSEITFEYHSPDGAEEVIERKCQLNVDAPYLVKKMASVDFVYFTQKNSLDRRKRTLVIEASNITFSSRVIVNEKCCYYVHPEHSDWTCFEQSASLDVKSFFGFESTVEKIAVKQYSANLAKGKEVLEFFIAELIKKGTTHIPPYVDSTPAQPSPTDSAIDVSKQDNEETESTSSDVKQAARRKSSSRTTTANETVETGMDSRRQSSSSVIKRFSIAANGPPQHMPSFDEAESKLESEYIQRFLGQLTPLEESRLCELKYGLQAAHKGKLPNDAHLLRFLRANEFDVGKARDMVINSILWRKQHNVDKILQDFVPPPVLVQFFPGGWHHNDKEGRPVFVLRLGQMDVKGLLRSVGIEPLVKFTLSICEQGLLKTTQATKTLGQPISAWTLLVDLEGLSMRHLWRPGVQALLRIIEIVEAHYPECMGLVLIARAPRVFPVLWTLISPFINENTRKKFMINSSEAVLTELSKYIDKQYLPDFLGGTSIFMGSQGGHVPKTEYRPVEEARKDEDDILTSTYQVASVHRGMPHEECVHVALPGSVLTWDFDILKGDCEFVLYHTPKVLKSVAQPHSPTLNPVERMTAAIGATSLTGSTNFPIASDPELKLGQELTVEEQPVFFSEGDSMQGSHFCKVSGTYIMQWRHAEHGNVPHQSFDFSLSHHKCKLMYYKEVLNSEEFRGSVASLESCRSSFSSLAAAAGVGADAATPMAKKRQEFLSKRINGETAQPSTSTS
jgi:hypothetical protein